MQCLGSYQCLEAVRTRDSVKLHLGAPTPHLEHSCVPPNFDDDVPFLKATLVQSGAGGTGPSVTNRQNISSKNLKQYRQFYRKRPKPTKDPINSNYKAVKKNFDLKMSAKNLERSILAKINSYNNEFMDKVGGKLQANIQTFLS